MLLGDADRLWIYTPFYFLDGTYGRITWKLLQKQQMYLSYGMICHHKKRMFRVAVDQRTGVLY